MGSHIAMDYAHLAVTMSYGENLIAIQTLFFLISLSLDKFCLL